MLFIKYAALNDGADFYIQCKGLHSGRPLKNYIPNSFSVFGSSELDFEKCFCIWKSKAYYYLLRGSVVPFVSIRETRSLLNKSFDCLRKVDSKKINAIKDIDSLIFNTEQKLKLYKNMQLVLAAEVLKVKNRYE